MNKNKFIEKMKEGVSVREIEKFTRKHMVEVVTIAALIIATISSSWNFFTGPKLTIFVMALGVVLGTFFPDPIEKGIKQLFSFSNKQEKTTQIILGIVIFIVAIFIPFVIFGAAGLLSGTAFHYFMRLSLSGSETISPKKGKKPSGDELD